MRQLTGVFAGVVVVFLWSCSSPTRSEFIHFQLNDSTEAVFQIDRHTDQWSLSNGGENLVLPKIADQLFSVPVFNGSIQLTGENQGYWTDSLRPTNEEGMPYQVDFQIKTSTTSNPSDSISGTWDVWFDASPGAEAATAQLDLTSTDTGVSGTIRTPTGDYRYLSGHFRQQQLHLQTFDGAHLFALNARRQGNQWINGHFYSGNHYHTYWSGVEADAWPVQQETEVLQVPMDSLYVRVVNRNGQLENVSLIPDSGQTLVVDILGSWCPNCMDEVRLLKEMHEAGPTRFISIAFERPDDVQQAYARIDEFRDLMDIPWSLYLGGKASKTVAADAFPFLETVVSFPTTLFIQDDGMVTVHSGFNGPATGDRYAAEQATFKRLAQSATATSLENR